MMIHNTITRSALIAAFAASTCSASAAPGAAAKPSCRVPNTEAIMRTNYPAEWPSIAEQQGASGTAVVRIDLSETGAVQNAVVVKSTGNTSLDKAAQESALEQQYAPRVRDCANVSGAYLINVDFTK